VTYDEATDTVSINDVKFSGDVFRHLQFPRLDRVYTFERLGDTVTISECGVYQNDDGELFVGDPQEAAH
jgi:hypothetical protein